jgi:hypothetical protein
MITLVSRCPEFTDFGGTKTVRILQDSRPPNGPQRSRIAVTQTILGEPAGAGQTLYCSYARLSRVVLTGMATPGNEESFDTLFENTLRRISAP